MIFLKSFDYDAQSITRKRGLVPNGRVQRFIDSEVLRRMSPYTPMDIGTLIGSATSHTSIGSGQIVQRTPYAKRWYYTPARFQGAPMRGMRWFERMKATHRGAILRGAADICGADVG